MKFKRQLLVVTLATAMLFTSAMLATPNETQSTFNPISVAMATEATTVATIGNTTYTSLQDALDVAKDGDVVTLTSGITLTTAVTIPAGTTLEVPAEYKITVEDEGSLTNNGKYIETDNFSFDATTGELAIMSNTGAKSWMSAPFWNLNDAGVISDSDRQDTELITSLTFGEGVTELTNTGTWTELGDFKYLHGLTELTIPGNIKTIGHKVFVNCDNLETLRIEDGVELIDGQAFYSVNSERPLSIEISGESLEKLGLHAFSVAGGDLNIPASVTVFNYRFDKLSAVASVMQYVYGTISINSTAALVEAVRVEADVTLETSIRLTEALEIPEEMTVTLADDVTITLESGATLTNNGTLTGDVICAAQNGDTYYSSLDNAITAAETGDTITVYDNIESAFTINKAVNLVAGNEGVTFENGILIQGVGTDSTAGVTIDGFIINATSNGRAIQCYQAIDNMTIQNNTVNGMIIINNDSNYNDPVNGPTLDNLTIKNNVITADENNCSGIFQDDGVNTTITGNTIVSTSYAGINFGTSSGRITNNVIESYGSQDGQQAALAFSNNTTGVVVTNNIITCIDGEYAVSATGNSYVDVTGNTWYGDIELKLLGGEDTKESVVIIEDEVSDTKPTVADKVETVLGEVAEMDVEDLSDDDKATVNSVALEVVDLVGGSSDAHEDETLVESVNTLDALFAEANEHVTVVATELNTDAVASDEKIEVSAVEGLAVAYYGDGDAPTEQNDSAELSLIVTQKDASGEEADLIFTAKPQVSINGATATEIENTDILAPITFNVYLPDTFTSNYAKVEHIFSDGSGSEWLTCKVLNDGTDKYIRITVTEFSTFKVLQHQVTYGSVKKYTNELEVGKGGDAIVQPLSAAAGTTVWITPKADEFYRVDEVIVDGGDVKVTDFGDGTYSYVQPSRAVDIEVIFEDDGTGRVEEQKEEETEVAVTKFADVKAGAWYEEYIAAAVKAGIMQGNSDTEFAPNGTTTRAMMITVLFNMEDQPATANDGKAWYSEAQAWAIEAGVSDGSDITGNLTREQLVTMLYRYAMTNGEDTSAKADLTKFSGSSKISAYAVDAFKWAVAKGIINGDANGNLNPQGTATRAELAKIMVSYLGE